MDGVRRVLRSAMVSACVLLASATPSSLGAQAQVATKAPADFPSSAIPAGALEPVSPQYKALQRRLASGWNTWDTNSVTTQVLLPEGLALQLGMKHNTTESNQAFLRDTLIGRLSPDAEQVFPGPHSWNGSYTDLRVTWKGHSWRVQSAHDGRDLVLLATPLASEAKAALPPTLVLSVNFLWNRPGTVYREEGSILAHSPVGDTRVFCSCDREDRKDRKDQRELYRGVDVPVSGPYFAADLTGPIAISTGSPRTIAEVQSDLEREHRVYEQSLAGRTGTEPIVDAIETTLGWDTTYDPEKQRVISPVSRIWSVNWGGYVLFDWDTFFAATMASVGDRDLAYADTMETLREATSEGFVPNYARGGSWKSFDRSEPPVGAITVLGLYQKYADRWFLEDTFSALLRWNRWWAQHRDIDGYLSWGSDGENPPGNLDDSSRGTRAGAILESGLDNSPMYDSTVYDPKSHVLQFADVGLMSMYIADCDALATIADTLHRTAEAGELRDRSRKYSKQLQTLWSPEAGLFLNKDLSNGQFSHRLSPTNFYPMLAHIATASQAESMVKQHMLNPHEFWGTWVLPSIALDDPAFKDQNYWRGRIWGPMNYLVYLGLRNYQLPEARHQLADKSYALFLKEWHDHGHVHENYNAMLGTGDDVSNSDRFYHWGALLGYMEYLEEANPAVSPNESTHGQTRGIASCGPCR